MKTSIGVLLLSLAIAALAFADKKHVHGEAELFVAVENNQVLIEFQSPATNLLGFEHTPSTEVEKNRVTKATQTLGDYTHLLTINGGDCRQLSGHTESPFDHDHTPTERHNDDHDYKDDHMFTGHKHDDDHEHETHSDFYSSYTLQCNNTGKIDSLTVEAFNQFQGIEKMQVNWVANNRQGTQTTTQNQPNVKL